MKKLLFTREPVWTNAIFLLRVWVGVIFIRYGLSLLHYGSNKVYVFLMGKDGVTSHFSLTVGNHPKGIALADINGDGKADILVCNNSDNDISIILSK